MTSTTHTHEHGVGHGHGHGQGDAPVSGRALVTRLRSLMPLLGEHRRLIVVAYLASTPAATLGCQSEVSNAPKLSCSLS